MTSTLHRSLMLMPQEVNLKSVQRTTTCRPTESEGKQRQCRASASAEEEQTSAPPKLMFCKVQPSSRSLQESRARMPTGLREVTRQAQAHCLSLLHLLVISQFAMCRPLKSSSLTANPSIPRILLLCITHSLSSCQSSISHPFSASSCPPTLRLMPE